jgi:hypothetical protein
MAASIELLSLPAEGVHTTLEAAKTALNLHSIAASYAFATGKNDVKKGK